MIHHGADLLPALHGLKGVCVPVPRLRKNQRGDLGIIQKPAGLGPVIDEVIQTLIADIADLTVMIAHRNQVDLPACPGREKSIEPVGYRLPLRAGGDDRHLRQARQFVDHLSHTGHRLQARPQRIHEDIIEYLFDHRQRYVQALSST